ncbi:MAG TPA: hypothetical protein VD970_01655 [Acetobacteraceae bacterium]|nr:hypothetical protein [Acetobacteraceae bacterium]
MNDLEQPATAQTDAIAEMLCALVRAELAALDAQEAGDTISERRARDEAHRLTHEIRRRRPKPALT